ncbi:MAG TPA: cytochrome c oxidase subunit II, partial [Chthoniobacterales bacterium]|nr:cytochrome c oxidase subunit II [Chthoniobacterales bacterium]
MSWDAFIAQIQFFPEQASKTASQVDLLFVCLLGITGTVTLAVAATVLFFLIRYRRNASVERTRSKNSSLAVEVTWSVIPLAIFMFLFGWGAKIYLHESVDPANATEIHVIGKQWMWKLQHLQGKREINELHVPVGRTIKLVMTSQDVIHSFFMPSFRIKEDVLPGRYTTQWFTPTKTGIFPLFCAQYCGTNHALMIGRVVVLEPAAFAEWLRSGPETVSIAQTGERLFHSLGCSGCHSAGASVRAPLLQGVFGSQVPLEDGRIIRADERYIRDSILLPNT